MSVPDPPDIKLSPPSPEITSSPQDIDDAMKLGFNWIRGPFEIIDALGIDTISVGFQDVYKFGGSFHSHTLDIKREGECKDYFLL